jgi:probable rRNA maturation factor
MPFYEWRLDGRDEMAARRMTDFPDFPKLPFEEEDLENSIQVHFEDVSFDFTAEKSIVDWLFSVAEQEQKSVGTVDFVFCSDEYLHKLNLEHLGHDDYTDVITFPYSDDFFYGDIFISTERVAENASDLNISFEKELARVMVHGLLHLAGMTDKTPELRAAMTAKENFYLTQLVQKKVN